MSSDPITDYTRHNDIAAMYRAELRRQNISVDMTWDDTIYEFARTHKYFNKKQLTTEITKSINQAMLAHWSAL